MPNEKISELTEIFPEDFTDSDSLPIVNGSATKRTTLESLDSRWLKVGSDTIYFGDPNTNGSFRISFIPPNLIIQSRVLGVWTNRDTITPT